MHRFNLCVLVWLGALGLSPAQTPLWGRVYEEDSREPIPGAVLRISGYPRLVYTDSEGYFNAQVQATASVTLWVKALGYRRDSFELVLPMPNGVLIGLKAQVSALDSVDILAPTSLAQAPIGKLSLSAAEVQRIPALGGEPDVLRSLQLMPGVQSSHEASSGLLVRGGSPDQNLILLDGVPVYNASHMLGVISTFPTDAVKQVDFYKGAFPARYGERLSSVVDITLKEGNREALSGGASLGLLASKLYLEGPLGSEKTSFLISGRRSFLDLFADPIQQLLDQPERLSYNFYDITAKVNHRFSSRDQVFLSVYAGRDGFVARSSQSVSQGSQTAEIEQRSGLNWGNRTAVLRWTHVGRGAWFSRVMLYGTDYRFAVNERQRRSLELANGGVDQQVFQLNYRSLLRDVAVQADWQFAPSPNHTLRSGAKGTYRVFSPATFVFDREVSDSLLSDSSNSLLPNTGWEWSAYLEDEVQLGLNWQLNLGLRLSGFLVQGRSYFIPQPRASLRWQLTAGRSFQASYSRMGQYIHLLSSSTVSLPVDLWVAATEQVPPQTGWQVAVSYAQELLQGWDFSLETYYRRMANVIEYQEGANLLLDGADPTVLTANQAWESQVVQGRGWAYGAELLLRRRQGAVTGWLSYGLAWARRQFDELNQGEVFPYTFDRRHDLSLSLQYTWRPGLAVGLTWVFQSGRAGNIPLATHTTHPILSVQGLEEYIAYYGPRNSYRFRPYHRLDLSFTWRKPKWGGEQAFKLGLYNAYSRRNPFALTFFNRPGIPRLVETSLFPILPIIAYQWKF